MMHFKKFAFGCFVASSIICSVLLSLLVWADMPDAIKIAPKIIADCVTSIPAIKDCPLFRK